MKNSQSLKKLIRLTIDTYDFRISLNEGLTKTYGWILSELKNDRSNTNKFCRS